MTLYRGRWTNDNGQMTGDREHSDMHCVREATALSHDLQVTQPTFECQGNEVMARLVSDILRSTCGGDDSVCRTVLGCQKQAATEAMDEHAFREADPVVFYDDVEPVKLELERQDGAKLETKSLKELDETEGTEREEEEQRRRERVLTQEQARRAEEGESRREAQQRKRDQERRRQELEAEAKKVEDEETFRTWMERQRFSDVNEKRRVFFLSFTYPLHVAVQENNADIVRMLVAAGADKNKKDWSGLTPEKVARTHSKKLGINRVWDLTLDALM